MKGFAGRFLRFFFHRLYRQSEAAFADPRRRQQAILASLFRANRESVFGREHGFDRCSSVADFRSRVPVADYSAFQPYVERMLAGEKNILTRADPFFFLTTSGTSGPVKYIPLNRPLDRDMSAAQRYWIVRMLQDHVHAFDRKILLLVSSPIEGRSTAGIPYGSTSGKYLLLHSRLDMGIKRLMLRSQAVPWPMFQVRDRQARQYLVALLSLCADVSFLSTVNPSYLIQLLEFVHEHRCALAGDIGSGSVQGELGERLDEKEQRQLLPMVRHRLKAAGPQRARVVETVLREKPFNVKMVWPALELIGCWRGGSVSFYIDHLKRYCPSVPIRDIGYRASEGFFALPDSDGTDAGILNVFSHFLEFSREGDTKQKTLLADELEIGGRYNLIVTQSGGLYRYDMDDIVEVVGYYKSTPRIRFCHKGGGTLSLTGEKITETHATRAMEQFSRSRQLPAGIHFCLTHEKEIPPYYIYIIEDFPGLAEFESRSSMPACLDGLLHELNYEYRGKRESGRLAPLRIWVVAAGSFDLFFGRFRPASGRATQFKFVPLISEESEKKWFFSRRIRELR